MGKFDSGSNSVDRWVDVHSAVVDHGSEVDDLNTREDSQRALNSTNLGLAETGLGPDDEWQDKD